MRRAAAIIAWVWLALGASTLAGCRARDPYAPIKPAVGDSALVRLKVLRPASWWKWNNPVVATKQTDFDFRTVLIRCVGASGQVRRFAVYYPARGRRGSIAYTVTVNYAATDLEKRTVVQNAAGRAVPRGSLVNGLPVPFHDFLCFDGHYLGPSRAIRRVQKLSDGRVAVLRRDDRSGGKGWRVYLEIRKPVRRPLIRPDTSSIQVWKSHDGWLWLSATGGSNDCRFYEAVLLPSTPR